MMKFQPKKFLVLLLTSFLLFSNSQIIDYLALPASASIHQKATIQESDLPVYNLKDETGDVWETVLFEKDNNNEGDIILRLVGHPLSELDHSQPLQIFDRDDILLEIDDLSTQKSPAFNVAEYSVRDILSKLPIDQTLRLSVYLTSDPEGYGSRRNRHVNLKLPSEIVRQWQEFAQTKQKSDRAHICDPLKITFLLA